LCLIEEKIFMAAGKSHGQDRRYQELCRDVLLAAKSENHLIPYDGDGIDVKFSQIGGSEITFDIVLKDSSKRLVVAECRRYWYAVKQEAIFAFARKVELLRSHTEQEVAGIFFARKRFQIGAIKHGNWSDIGVAVLDQNQSTLNFALVYQKYSFERHKKLQEGFIHLTAEVRPTGSLTMIVTRSDGKVEEHHS
jgi:hypothetical protein